MKSSITKVPFIAPDVTIDNAAVKSSSYLGTDASGKIIKQTVTPGAIVYAVIDETKLGDWLVGGVSVTGTSGNPVMNMTTNAFVNGEVTGPNTALTNVPMDVPFYVRVLSPTTFSIFATRTQALNSPDNTGRVTPGTNPTTTWFNFAVNPILQAVGVDSVIPRGTPFNDFYLDLSADKPNANYPIFMQQALQATPALKEIKTVAVGGISWINTPLIARLSVMFP